MNISIDWHQESSQWDVSDSSTLSRWSGLRTRSLIEPGDQVADGELLAAGVAPGDLLLRRAASSAESGA